MSFGKVGLKPVADWSIALAFVDRVQLSGVSAEKPDETRQRMSCCHGDAWCGSCAMRLRLLIGGSLVHLNAL